MIQLTETQQKIVRALYNELERLGASVDTLAAVGSWGDTLQDEEVLSILENGFTDPRRN